jgi:uncharacterized coiled-coil protein SlyX
VSTIHSVPCAQEDRLVRIEEDMSEQGKCLVRIESKLETDYKVIGKMDEKLTRLVEGNSTPGLLTRVTTLEVIQGVMERSIRRTHKLLWALIFLMTSGLVTGIISLWPKI